MTLKNKGNKIAGVLMVFLLTLGVGFASNAPRSAEPEGAPQGRRNRDWGGYPDLGGSFQLRQTALNAGFNEGSKEGRKDREKRRYSEYTDFDSYRKASKDYSSKLGDRDLYERYFRMAFESGYDSENARPGRQRRRGNYDQDNRRGRNWDRYGLYGGSFELRQTALNAGYNEGIKQGRGDAKKGRYRDYRDFNAYQKATEDYSLKLGDRELYRRYYREGFENGYEDGFNGY